MFFSQKNYPQFKKNTMNFKSMLIDVLIVIVALIVYDKLVKKVLKIA